MMSSFNSHFIIPVSQDSISDSHDVMIGFPCSDLCHHSLRSHTFGRQLIYAHLYVEADIGDFLDSFQTHARFFFWCGSDLVFG